MGGIAIDLLPGDAELARRAAGGDGAAFVRLYDHYSADVFEASLAATGSVEKAADATQIAFLKLLKRPPAIDAPDSEVAERLRGIALGAGVEAAPMSRRTAEGNHIPRGAGVGWLRSETVAKASARFDQDWSAHLDHEPGDAYTLPEVPRTPPVERVESERPLVVPVAVPPPVEKLEYVAEPRRRMRPLALTRVPLPSAGALGALLLLALVASALGVVLTSGGGESTERAARVDAPKSADRPAARGDVAGVKRSSRGASRTRRRGGRAAARPATGPGTALAGGGREVDLVSYNGPSGRAPAGSRGGSPRVTRPVSAPAPTGGGGGGGTTSPDATKSPQAITVSPPSDPPPPESEPAPTTSEPAPAPAPTDTSSGGANRNCNSKRSSSPC